MTLDNTQRQFTGTDRYMPVFAIMDIYSNMVDATIRTHPSAFNRDGQDCRHEQHWHSGNAAKQQDRRSLRITKSNEVTQSVI